MGFDGAVKELDSKFPKAGFLLGSLSDPVCRAIIAALGGQKQRLTPYSALTKILEVETGSEAEIKEQKEKFDCSLCQLLKTPFITKYLSKKHPNDDYALTEFGKTFYIWLSEL